MGRKLRSSRIGRALDNSARRMRDAYSRRRDLLRRQQKIRQEQLRRRRDERNRRETPRRPSKHGWRESWRVSGPGFSRCWERE
ncbi:hypothetical protein GQS52_03930 [Streptomyces sp. SCUT-3]|uniref:hypothetical protein n=1 Tax=Streptomyces sp. SCUT-3 TaxID=2684469 RepID=UPI0015FD6B14|nr:hypothetical protein [Streptomyces sp. SCUT-3]QMV21061.1 hypothetical protein GQS52_03930 [Streptomyces sp. SCUT-3]